MPAPPRPLRADVDLQLFTVAGALAAGVAPDRLRRRDLATPVRGTRTGVRSDEDPFGRIVRATALLLAAPQFFSHVTAAMIWGCPVPFRFRRGRDRRLHVSTVGNGPIERRVGVIGHRVAPGRAAISVRDGVRTSTPERFWYECRTLLGIRELVVLGDHLIGPAKLSTAERLGATIVPGDRAVSVARAAIDLVRPGAESPMESIVRLIVVDAGFPEPSINVDVFDAVGVFIGRADLSWAGIRIAIEYDGDHHRTDPAAFVRDRARGNAFAAADWFVLHLTAADVRSPADFLEHLRTAFALRSHFRT